MTGQLPEVLEVSGEKYPINADFRNVLTIFEAFADKSLTDREKAYICTKRLYRDDIPVRAYGEAVRQAYWFCDGGDMPRTKPESFQIIDWKHDEHMIFPAVSKAAGVIDIRSLPFVHWWTFLGLFGEIGEGLFSAVVDIRRKIGKGRKLTKYEREFLSTGRDIIILHSDEELQDIRETEEFLKKFI